MSGVELQNSPWPATYNQTSSQDSFFGHSCIKPHETFLENHGRPTNPAVSPVSIRYVCRRNIFRSCNIFSGSSRYRPSVLSSRSPPFAGRHSYNLRSNYPHKNQLAIDCHSKKNPARCLAQFRMQIANQKTKTPFSPISTSSK